MEKIVPILFNKKSECMGCTACYSVCPTKAISMVSDNEGFLYPTIDKALCINCKSCIKVCVLKEIKDEYIQR